MDKKQLQDILQQPYSREQWNVLLNDIFPSVGYYAESEIIPTNNQHVKSFKQIGFITLKDGKRLAIFEILLDEHINLIRNRVALRNLTSKYIDEANNHGVLVIYDQGDDNYRLTFAARQSGFNKKGEWATFETAAKRFTYVLGKGETCRTAADRLMLLANKKTHAKLKDVIEAFSVEQLSKSFFKSYNEHYIMFVNYLSDNNTHDFKSSIFHGNEKTIRDFVKKMMGRIVFLYFLQKKGWLGAQQDDFSDGDKNFMRTFWDSSEKNERFYSSHLSRLFFEGLNLENRKNDFFLMPNGSSVKIPFLNGGLFDEENIKYRSIIFPGNIFESLFSFLGEYNFTIDENDPNEQEIGIDPEMLGHIFENLLEENRKKHGAYYTPKEIVEYMTQESLIEYIKTGFEKNGLELFESERNAIKYLIRYKLGDDFFENSEPTNEELKLYLNQGKFIRKHGAFLNQLLDDVKICDPAIGSGAFPMGVLNEIYHCKLVLNNTLTNSDRATIKRHIIENSIYGVDKEKGAVDIARLRFWLSLIIEEEKPTALPNLDFKIVVGNTLITTFEDQKLHIDWNIRSSKTGKMLAAEIRKELTALSDMQKEFFESQNKKSLKKEIRDLKLKIIEKQIRFNQKKYNQDHATQGDIFKKKVKKKKQKFEIQDFKQLLDKIKTLTHNHYSDREFQFFDWKLNFPEILNPEIADKKPGFDIIIGNPPYIQLQKLGDETDKLQEAEYNTFVRTGDIYELFYEKGLSLLKTDGHLSYITSSTWMRANHGEKLRQFFLDNYNPKHLIDFSDYPIFDTATVLTNIITVQNCSNKNNLLACRLKKNTKLQSSLAAFFESSNINLENLDKNGWNVTTRSKFDIISKLKDKGTKLKDWNIKINYGIKTGLNNVFVIPEHIKDQLIQQDSKAAEIIKPLLRGRDIKKYYFEFENKWLIFTRHGINIDYYPSIKRYLENFRTELEPKPAGFKGKWNGRKAGAYKWYEIQDNIAYHEDFSKPKLIYPEISKYLPFTFDKEGFFTNNKNFILTGDSIGYLAAFFNSRLFKFCFEEYFPELQGNSREMRKVILREIPVLPVALDTEEKFNILVDYILYLKSTAEDIIPGVNNSHIASFFEDIIDGYIFELYFKEHLQERELIISEYVNPLLRPIENQNNKVAFITELYQNLRKTEPGIKIKQWTIKSPELLKLIIHNE